MNAWRDTPYEKAIHDGLAAANMAGVTRKQADAILDGLNAAGLLPNADSDSAVLAELRVKFAEVNTGGSSNDVVQMLDDFLTSRGLPTVLYV